jgi:predicted nucleic acid-binding protein
MSGKKIILDSNIIIYLSQDRILPDDLIVDKNYYFISAVTYMEVLGYKFDSVDEEKIVRDLLNLFTIIYIDERITEKVIEIRRQNKIKLPDAIICATAISCKATLFSNDRKLEKIKNLKIEFIQAK